MSTGTDPAPPPRSAAGSPLPEGMADQRLTQVLLTGGLLLTGMLLGLAAQALIAYFFGASARSDALFLARDSAELLAKLLLPAQAAGILVPMFLTARAARGDATAWREVAAVLTAMLAVALPLATTAALAAPALVTIVAPGFDEPTADLAVDLLRILGATAASVAMGAVAVSLLQARERFGQAMGTHVAGSALALAAMPPLVSAWDVRGAALALLAGTVGQAVLAWVLLVREGLPGLVAPWRHRGFVADFARRLTPFLAYAGAVQLSGVVLRASASTLSTGLFAVLVLAQRLYRAVVSLMLTPVQMVLLPALAAHHATGASAAGNVELFATLRYVMAIVVPIAAGLAVLREPSVSVVFERGEFSAADAEATALALGFFALALVPVGLYTMLEQAGFARRRARLVVGVNVSLELVQAALYLPLTLLLGVRGIPIAVAAATGLATVLYLRGLHRGEWRTLFTADGFAWRLAGATAALALVAAGSAAAIDAIAEPPPGLSQLLVLIPAAAAGSAAYLAAAHGLRLPEPGRLGAMLGARLTGGSPPRGG